MAKETIKLKKYVDIVEEYEAAGTITPGMLVELASATTVQAHSDEDGNALPMFALEDELQGNGISDDYSAEDMVQVWVPVRGEIVNAILASGENASVGNFVTSNGDGKLKVMESLVSTGDVDTNEIVGQVIVASNASVADTRVQIRVI